MTQLLFETFIIVALGLGLFNIQLIAFYIYNFRSNSTMRVDKENHKKIFFAFIIISIILSCLIVIPSQCMI